MATPLEIIGSISAIVGILQAAIDVADRMMLAKDSKGWTNVVDRNRKEVKSLKEIIALIEAEEALQTKEVIAEIAEMSEGATKVQDLLKTMEDSKFVSKVVHGKNLKEELSNLTGDVAKVKTNLMVKIESAHVGLTVLANKTYAVQVQKIESVELQLKQLIDGFNCLEISTIVKGREPGADGTIPLEEPDLLILGLRTEDDGPYQDGSRIITDNMTCNQATMINGTVGTEGFIEPKHVKIFNNAAKNHSMMINASISKETLHNTMAYQLEVIKIISQ